MGSGEASQHGAALAWDRPLPTLLNAVCLAPCRAEGASASPLCSRILSLMSCP